MAESGGPTTQSGIYFQNSLAALYLGRLCDPRPFPRGKQVVSVRIEAPLQIDDVVIVHADSSRLLIQAKESIGSSGEDWTKFWHSVRQQAESNVNQQDNFVLAVGRYTAEIDVLREACERSRGKESYEEWWSSLSSRQKTIAEKAISALTNDARSAFPILHRTFIEVQTLRAIESTGIRDWIPPSNVSQDTLFSLLRDSCGGRARIRKTFRAPELLDELFSSHGVKITDAPHSGLEEYRTAIVRAYGRIAVPGTAMAGPVEDLFLWPKLVEKSNRQAERDFEEEDIRFRWPEQNATVDLNNFPFAGISRAIIDAGAGFGKTTLLRAKAHQLALRPTHLPALVPLDSLAKQGTVDEYLLKVINQIYRVNVDWQALCETGRAVMLFDGLDELDDGARTKVIGMIERFIARYNNVTFLLTVRDSSILAAFENTKILQLQPLDFTTVKTFIEHYCPNKSHIDPLEAIRQFEHHSDLLQLIRIPLYLAIFLATLKPGEKLPTNRTSVLERYLTVLFSPERHKERIDADRAPEDLREAAEFLAHAALESNAIGIEERDARLLLQNAKLSSTPYTYIRFFIQDGILSRQGNRLRFYFPILQEYLAARWMVTKQPQNVEARFSQIVRRPWAQSLQFAVELHPDAESIIERQLAKTDDAFRTALRLMARCIVNGAHVSGQLRQEVCRRLVAAWSSPSHYVKRSIGHLIADGFSCPPSPQLRLTLRQRFTDGYGRDEIVQTIDSPALTLELLHILLGNQDIRELWSKHWQSSIAAVWQQALPMLIERARREPGSTLAASVVARVIMGACKKAAIRPLLDLTSDFTLPGVVRLVAYYTAGAPLPHESLYVVDELVSELGDGGPADDILRDIYFEIDGWREHFCQLAKGARVADISSLRPFLDLAISKSPQVQLFLKTIRELAHDPAVKLELQFELLAALAALGDDRAGREATAMLQKLSSEYYFAWLGFIFYFPDDAAVDGVRFIRAANLDLATSIEFLSQAAFTIYCKRTIPTVSLFYGHDQWISIDETPAALETLTAWAIELLEGAVSIESELEILAVLLHFRRVDYGPRLVASIERFIAGSNELGDEGWSALAGAMIAAETAQYKIDSRILWKIVYQFPDWPVGSTVIHIAEREKIACHPALLECYERHPSRSVKRQIFEYFEKQAPRLGIRVLESEDRLVLQAVGAD